MVHDIKFSFLPVSITKRAAQMKWKKK